MIDIKKLVADEFDIEILDLTKKTRRREVVDARKAYCSIMRKYFKTSLHRIGFDLRRDHSTVMHSLKSHKQLMQFDAIYRTRYNRCLDFLDEAGGSIVSKTKIQLLQECREELLKVQRELENNKLLIHEITKRQNRILSK